MSINLLAAKQAFIHPALIYNWRIVGIPGVDSDLNVKSSAIPGVTYTSIPLHFSGRQVNFNANVAKFNPWICTIQEDVGYSARTALEAWLNFQGEPVTGIGMLTPVIQKHLEISLLEPGTQRIICTYGLQNCFPTTIADVQLDQQQAETVFIYQCTFVFDYFYRVAPADSFAGMANMFRNAGLI